MILESIIITIYTIALLLILMYALAQLNLLFNYLSAKRKTDKSVKFDLSNPDEIPFVTIQLPVYNEMYVMQRLLDNIAEIDYPNDKLEIQVLDDSTDETIETTRAQVEVLKATGLDIKHITRTNRVGFKAGALKEGLEIAKGEFIAIFDSDFLPKKDWLKQTVPYFKDSEIGVVQTRWGHINRNYSILTKIQAFALDAHFTLEQVGRNSKGHFINFNGTAGLWRKACILDAGNWEGDTLTEDLDLSYRAQLKNWKFKYLEDVETPAELPVVISAARSQQFRWNKGGAENFKKMKWRVLKSKNISTKTKIHGLLHLLNSTMFLNILLVAILSIPMLYIKNEYAHLKTYFIVMSFFVISTLIFFICYWVMYKNIYGGGVKNFVNYIAMFFVFFSIAMGFSLHNTIAVIEGHIGKKSEFVRTPKFNISKFKDNLKTNQYIKKTVSINVIFEGLLMAYFGFGMYSAFIVGNQGGDFGLFPFHLMLFLGFGFVFIKSLVSKV
ncbi:cellulose synthase family protein [Algibacter lectus]|uniref:Glycosyltransferase n=1 Tax=Algibacter lectus TaxID=221126 RepID=A0A090W760_9FLAO|nr:cellulose synthase family protein [Algibacter lectus]MWW26317.1 glycosyltransferase [Algibacter lectus]TDY60099.1 cellulose synthase/poly-beta-1,6-N-acetylglucosamine synthase-like glycosyltransferase [Algibacter lectus]GAL63362.1 glycosyltransferase [Algibacter lectus]SFD42820.1 Glycosyltransferase, catalytic subunit of cellulose synthase and poly-beta-1,6-N-acetylglucosamine synthase [Algibacter lectus]